MPPPRKRRKLLLSHTRSPSTPSTSTPSSKATRALIRTHHNLRKQHAAALRQNDSPAAASIAAQLDQLGGLHTYQAASVVGQSIQRGGDSSKVLVEWIQDAQAARGETRESENENERTTTTAKKKLSLLEVGALQVDNACSRSGFFEVERIDLHAREEGIKQEDFMERPIPPADGDGARFDVVSLSLVLNFVPDAEARGNMLKRTTRFLRHERSGQSQSQSHIDYQDSDPLDCLLPCLFLVLPAPCVLNSRYLDDQKLENIMNGLGYDLVRRKMTAKLVYSLWTWKSRYLNPKAEFKKVELRSGKSRNNFAIVLRKSTG